MRGVERETREEESGVRDEKWHKSVGQNEKQRLGEKRDCEKDTVIKQNEEEMGRRIERERETSGWKRE